MLGRTKKLTLFWASFGKIDFFASIDNDYQFDDDDEDWLGRLQRGLSEINRSRLNLLQGGAENEKWKKDKKTKYKIQIAKKCQKSTIL